MRLAQTHVLRILLFLLYTRTLSPVILLLLLSPFVILIFNSTFYTKLQSFVTSLKPTHESFSAARVFLQRSLREVNFSLSKDNLYMLLSGSYDIRSTKKYNKKTVIKRKSATEFQVKRSCYYRSCVHWSAS